MRSFKLILSITFLSLAANLTALNLDSEFNLSGRYRRDEINRTQKVTVNTPGTITDKIDANDLDTWQLGFDGRFIMPPLFCDCFEFLNNFYVDGYAYWGYGGKNGKLTENSTTTPSEERFAGRAKLTDAQNSNFQVGLGYLFPWECWGLGLSAGYSYDKFAIKPKHGKSRTSPETSFATDPRYRKGYTTSHIWHGPWVGLEGYFEWCAWIFDVGYEAHFATFNLIHSIADNPIAEREDLAIRGRSNNAFGNVAFLDAHYYVCDTLVVSAGFKYQHWNVDRIHTEPKHGTFISNRFPTFTKVTNKVTWSSYCFSLDMGYFF